MAGINFNDLPKNLQAKLNEFRFVAKSVDDAIEMAKAKGTWTEADTKAMNALNGSANWGNVVDTTNFKKANEKFVAEDSANNPKKYAPKRYDLPSGRYIVYQKDAKTGKDTYKFYAKNGKQLKEEYFKKQEGLATVAYDKEHNALAYTKKGEDFFQFTDKDGKFSASATAKTVGKAFIAAVAAPFAIFASCKEKDDVTEYNFVNENKNTFNVTVVNENSSIADLVAALNEAISGLRDDLNDIKDLIVTVITNQEKNAANFQAYAKMILDAVGDNSALIKILIEQMTENNSTLAGIRDLIIKNHEEDVSYQKKVLELLAGIKFSVDKISGDLKEYYNNIIANLVNNHASLETIEKLIKTLNNNVDNLNKLVTMYGNKGTDIANAILKAINNLDFNTTVDLSGIEALLKKLVDGQKETQAQIAKLTTMFEKFSGDTVALLNTVIELMGNDSAKLDAIINLLTQMDANNEARTVRILNAIKTAGANVVVKLDEVIAKLDKNAPDYSEQLNKIIALLEQLDANNEARNEKVLAAIEKLGADVSTDLAAILKAIKELPSSQQKDYTEILNAILDKIKEGNAQNDANFKAVLAKINDLGVSVAYGMNAILDAIQGMPDYTEKLNAIIAKLDALGETAKEILQAIKDHDVKITVDVTGKVKCECNCNCGGTHEGIIGDLNDLLG